MIENIEKSQKDADALANAEFSPESQKKEDFDYSGLIVEKPWGFEYQFMENQIVAIWILSIKKGHNTSLHCHPSKTTSLIVLNGIANLHTLEKDIILKERDGVHMQKGVFHQTNALTDLIVMEIESPVNKRDLVRISDSYGREKKGYEGKENCRKNGQLVNNA